VACLYERATARDLNRMLIAETTEACTLLASVRLMRSTSSAEIVFAGLRISRRGLRNDSEHGTERVHHAAVDEARALQSPVCHQRMAFCNSAWPLNKSQGFV
jgi:hypothetical protein